MGARRLPGPGMVRSTAMFVALVPEGIGVVVGSGSTAITTVTTLVIVTVAAEDADVGVLLSASVVEGAPLLLDAEEKEVVAVDWTDAALPERAEEVAIGVADADKVANNVGEGKAATADARKLDGNRCRSGTARRCPGTMVFSVGSVV